MLARFAPAPDVLQVGRNLAIGAGQHVHNVVCILCSTEVGGDVGTVRVFAGNVLLKGTAAGNIDVFGGNVTLAGGAAVAGRVVILGGHLQQDSAATCSQTVFPPIIFLPAILLICAVVGVLIRLTRRSVREPSVFPPLPRL